MIPVVKEPSAWVDRGYPLESCRFCRKPTLFWHKRTNNPVCPECAKNHKVGELINYMKKSVKKPE